MIRRPTRRGSDSFFFVFACLLLQAVTSGLSWEACGGKRLSSPQLAGRGCGSLPCWLTDGGRPTGAPDQRSTLFTSASCTSGVLTATPPTPAGASAATKPGPGKVRRAGGPWPSTVGLRIRCASEGKPARMLWSEWYAAKPETKGADPEGSEEAGSFAHKMVFLGFDSFSHQGQRSHLSQGHWPAFIATLGNCG